MDKKYNESINKFLGSINDTRSTANFIANITKPIENIHDFYIKHEVFSSKEHIIDQFPIKKHTDRIGVLIQGPIFHKLEFTITTVRMYIQLFKNPIIVISTWNNDDTSGFNIFDENNVIIIKNDPPKQKGFLNLNNQIVSTIEGLNVLKKYGVKYAFKTRTDTRIQYENVDDFMLTLLEAFKLGDKEKLNQNSRIVILDMFTFKYVPFHFSDMLQFSHINDLIDYWNVELSNKRMRKSELYILLEKGFRICDEINHQESEVYLGTKYAKSKEPSFIYDYENYYKMLSKRFIVIDSSMIGLLWNKCTISGWQCYTAHESKLCQTILFKDWILLSQGIIDIKSLNNRYEEKLNQCRMYNIR